MKEEKKGKKKIAMRKVVVKEIQLDHENLTAVRKKKKKRGTRNEDKNRKVGGRKEG